MKHWLHWVNFDLKAFCINFLQSSNANRDFLYEDDFNGFVTKSDWHMSDNDDIIPPDEKGDLTSHIAARHKGQELNY